MTPLGREIAERIASEGPITVERYMALCLGHPVHGYYATRDPFGAAGDFVTAPEISQMFGELIGLWCAEVWRMMGEPARVALVELGPGRGTLMSDALRAAKAVPAFRQAIEVTLVETSPTLREAQRRALEGAGAPLRWASSVEEAFFSARRASEQSEAAALHLSPAGRGRSEGPGEGASRYPDSPDAPHPLGFADRPHPAGERWGVTTGPDDDALIGSELISKQNGRPALHPDRDPGSAAGAAVRDDAPAPAIVIANEFFDALPVRQFVRVEGGWRERLVGLAADGALAFGLAAEPPADVRLPERPLGATIEVSPQSLAIAARIGAHLAGHGGAMLAIDYGGAASAGDTLQAVRRHRFVDPLAESGEADLTAHVDFGAFAAAARAAGAAATELVAQAELLERLGLAARAARLAASGTPAQAAAVAAAAARLTGRAPTGMGALFKAIAILDPRLGVPPGFAGLTHPLRIPEGASR